MKDILEHKATQCPQFASAIKKTAGKTLLHNVESDSFWGCGVDLKGSNVLGSIINDLRSKLQQGTVTLQQNSDALSAGPPSPALEEQNEKTVPFLTQTKVIVIRNSNARGVSKEL